MKLNAVWITGDVFLVLIILYIGSAIWAYRTARKQRWRDGVDWRRAQDPCAIWGCSCEDSERH